MRRKSATVPSTGPPSGFKTAYEGQMGTSGRIKPYYQNWWQATNWSMPVVGGRTAPNKTYSSSGTLTTALAGLVDGDWLAPTSSFTISASGGNVQNITSKSFATGARIDFGNAAGTHVTFQQTDTAQWLAVLINNCTNLYLSGGEMTSAVAGSGIQFRGNCTNVWWLDPYIHNTGGAGLDMFTNDAFSGTRSTITNCRVRIQVKDWGNDKAADTHAEKGTGWHGANTADAVDGSTGVSGTFTNNVVAVFATEPGTTAASGQTGGSVAELGFPTADGTISGCRYFLFGGGLTMAATSQTAGNCMNVWGSTPFSDVAAEYLEHRDSTGRTFDTNGTANTGILDTGKMIVKHGRSINTNTAVSGGDTRDASTVPYQVWGGATLQDIAPTVKSTVQRTFGG